MKDVFVDTNIVIDLLSKREPFYQEAAELFSLADKNEINLSLSALTISNSAFILQRQLSPSETKSILRKLRLIVNVLPLDDKTVGLALNDEGFNDIEDAMQYYTALENGQEVIITRNLKDYKSSKIPVMTAKQYISQFRFQNSD